MDTSFDFDIKEVIIKHEMDKTVEIDAQVLAELVGNFVRSLDHIRARAWIYPKSPLTDKVEKSQLMMDALATSHCSGDEQPWP